MYEKLESAWEARGMTQDAVERAVGLPKGRISKWKNGQGAPKAVQALYLARYFGLPVEYLIDDARDDPASVAPLTDDERAVLDLFRALGLAKDVALRALARAIAAPQAARAPLGAAAPPSYTQGEPIPGVTVTGVEAPTQEQAREILRKRRTR